MAKKEYSKLEKVDLLKVIEKLESRKKYELIWDEEKAKEQFEKESTDWENRSSPTKKSLVFLRKEKIRRAQIKN